MRNKRRDIVLASGEDTQYCVVCETVAVFERVEAGDHPVDDPAGEWICVTCGSALLIGPPLQHLETA
ncbi:hypothetical protein EV643_103130 [Kribbella sp. VKM Ac-2527]|uniref:Uncharacterized protein n=1 Tax=Kribbella caucasensis TaxID=2512215 RepID=A0A4R6KJT7_9ACTN|nr:hypothetical protein [Kribbella sp. VKM Ac-2527]TDO51393.1 hypothetical protein EV643_103130 [Kribbella sp. VKM Ac-2527]